MWTPACPPFWPGLCRFRGPRSGIRIRADGHRLRRRQDPPRHLQSGRIPRFLAEPRVNAPFRRGSAALAQDGRQVKGGRPCPASRGRNGPAVARPPPAAGSVHRRRLVKTGRRRFLVCNPRRRCLSASGASDNQGAARGALAPARRSGMELYGIEGNPVPDGAVVGTVTTPDGVRLRYARWRPSAGRSLGTLCVLQGRAESIEENSRPSAISAGAASLLPPSTGAGRAAPTATFATR